MTVVSSLTMTRTPSIILTILLTAFLPTSAGCDLFGGVFGDEEEFGTRKDLVRRLSEVRAEARTCGSKEFPAAGPLRWNADLASAAHRHARDLATTGGGGHTGSDGSTPRDRISDTGYEAASIGEVVAVGEESREGIVQAWLASPGHCAVIMNANFSEAGGAVQGLAWVVDFARPR